LKKSVLTVVEHLQGERQPVLIVEQWFSLDEIQNSKFPKIGPRSLLVQGILGLLALFLFMINSVITEKFLPDTVYWGTFLYVLFSLSTMIILGIQTNSKTTEARKKCHYCDGPIEINSYKCKSCGKEQ